MGQTAEAPARDRVRMTLEDAAEALSKSVTTVRRMVARGEFTTIRDGHGGHGDPVFLRRDEVMVRVEGGLAGLKKFRRQKGRAK